MLFIDMNGYTNVSLYKTLLFSKRNSNPSNDLYNVYGEVFVRITSIVYNLSIYMWD